MEPSNPYTSPTMSNAQDTAYRAQSSATRTMRIKRIDVLSVAKMLGALYAVIGLIFGLIFGVIMLGAAATGMNGNNAGPAMAGGIVGFLGAVVIAPFFYGILGFIGGAIAAFFYNIIAGMAGGIELEIEV